MRRRGRFLPKTATDAGVSLSDKTRLSADRAKSAGARVAELLPQLRSRSGRFNADVLERLIELGPAAVPGLMAQVNVKRRIWRNIGYCVVRGLLLFFVGFPAASNSWDNPFRVLKGTCINPFRYVDGILTTHFPRPGDVPVVKALVEIGDVRSLGLLIRVLRWETGDDTKREMRVGLTKMLPRLGCEDGRLLNRGERRLLRRWLKEVDEPHVFIPDEASEVAVAREFLIAVIKALVQIRDMDSLPALRWMADQGRKAAVRRMAEMGVAELEGRIADGAPEKG